MKEELGLIALEREIKKYKTETPNFIEYNSATIMGYFIAVFFFIFKMSTCLVFLACYLQKKSAAPFPIWENPIYISIILLIIGIFLNVLSMVSYVSRINYFRKLRDQFNFNEAEILKK